MSDDDDLAARLAALEAGKPRYAASARRLSGLPSLALIALLGAGGTALFLMWPAGDEIALATATPEEFQAEGDGFGMITPFVPPPRPEPELVVVTEGTPAPDAELRAQLAALRTELNALKSAPPPVIETDNAAAAALEALTAEIAKLQDAADTERQRFEAELAARDRDLQQLRLDLDLAQLAATRPVPAPPAPSDEERAAQDEAARRLAEHARRAGEAQAFQARRIASPILAFRGAGTTTTDAADRAFDPGTDFVRNGAPPAKVTQAKTIANPAQTIVQGTMIQAVMETALESTLPGQTRAIVSEDVYSFDGTRRLIPRGARLIGRYRSGLEIAQSRVTIAWDRILLPGGQTVEISAFGGDDLGRSGVTGFVDTRFDERFGSAALISIIAATPGALARPVKDKHSADVLHKVGDDFAETTGSVIGDYLSIEPVIHVDQGARVTVMVDRDLEIF